MAARGNPRRLFSFLRLRLRLRLALRLPSRAGRPPASRRSSGRGLALELRPGCDAGRSTGGDDAPILVAPNSTALFRGFNHVSQARYLRSTPSTQTHIFDRSGTLAQSARAPGFYPEG